MQFFLSLLLSLGLMFGWIPNLAYADELDTGTSEYDFGSDNPDGKYGRFGYAMSLNGYSAYFPGTANWELTTPPEEIGGQDLKYYANNDTNSWRKYYIYNRYFNSGEKVQINPLPPVSNVENVDFLFWYQKDASTRGQYNGGRSFYVPGEVIYYDGGTGTPNSPANESNIYSVDAVWGIWTTEDKTVTYDGTKYLPTVSYAYNYNSTKGTQFGDDIQNQLQELVQLTVDKNGTNIYTSPNSEWNNDISPSLNLVSAAQADAGTYIYNCSIDYKYTDSENPFANAANTANLTILPRSVKITGKQTVEYTGQTITVNFSETQNTTWTETTEDAGIVEGQELTFNISVSGLKPGVYTIDVTNENVSIMAGEQNVTSNYLIDGTVTLIIEGEEPPEIIDPKPEPTPDPTPDPEPSPEPDPEPGPDDPPIIEPDPEPTPDEPDSDEPTINEPSSDEPDENEQIIDEPNKNEFEENKPIIEKPKTIIAPEKALPQTGDIDYTWLFVTLTILGAIGLFIARRFE